MKHPAMIILLLLTGLSIEVKAQLSNNPLKQSSGISSPTPGWPQMLRSEDPTTGFRNRQTHY